MSLLILKILLIIYLLYALLKFFEFFFRGDEAKMKGLRMVYGHGGRAIKILDNFILVVMVVFADGDNYDFSAKRLE